MTLKPGDRIVFTLAPDIPGIVNDVLKSESGEEYRLAWFDNNGIRIVDIVKPWEVRKLFKD